MRVEEWARTTAAGTGPVCDLVGVGLHPHLTRAWLAPKAVTYDKTTVTDNKCITAQLPLYIKLRTHLILRVRVYGSVCLF